MSKKLLSTQKTERRIDPETGELLDVTIEKTFNLSKKNEPFFMTYIKGLSIIYGIKSAAALRLLYRIMEMTKLNSNEVQISAPKKKQILKDLNISLPCFTKSMQILIEKGLISGGRGLYYISEDIFWRGDSQSREQLFRDRGAKITFVPSEEFDIKEEE